ncbi:transcription initiation factor TFIID subunit 4b-like isoform X1 [Papaver somniferum]|uniref:transcription initiation factor TFIID subunit 4b-like isoform X1 n=1 Tax=Papaver somniferum TaxID=3469 RepID=UPI000E6FDB68|nr:transcription initiation factor TFIID subunit 4b-like isoform X1 [Papaver somniferum]
MHSQVTPSTSGCVAPRKKPASIGRKKQLDAHDDQVTPSTSGSVDVKTPRKKPASAGEKKRLDAPDDKMHSQVAPSTSGCVVMKTPLKKPSVGQKKRLNAHEVSSPVASKKQKVSEGIHENIEEFNDVVAGTGVNYWEEQELLLAVPKKDSRASEAAQRIVQQEEEIFLQKNPFLKKVPLIISKCGIKHLSSNVALCLSVCVEWRLSGLICELIRLSKQRADTERLRHRTIDTSDVLHQVLLMNQAENWVKKQVEEAQKIQKLNEANKEAKDDKMRTVAANIAAHAALGADDIFSKWQLMFEQARQKRDGVVGMSSAAQSGDEDRGPSRQKSGAMRISGRKIGRTISVKDMIAVLERDHHLSKSIVLYCLLDRLSGLRR